MSKTKVVSHKFRGKEMFTIFKEDKDGVIDTDERPFLSMGISKAKALIDHLDELKEYVERNK